MKKEYVYITVRSENKDDFINVKKVIAYVDRDKGLCYHRTQECNKVWCSTDLKSGLCMIKGATRKECIEKTNDFLQTEFYKKACNTERYRKIAKTYQSIIKGMDKQNGING